MLYKRSYAYQADAVVNYDPVDKTVLANEQVDSNGRSWRSGALVQQVSLRQWFFRIKTFQEDLLKGLDSLAHQDKWPERVVAQQRNWLGKSSGARVRFELIMEDGSVQPVHVFTTRPDTLFGVTHLALSLSHPLVTTLAKACPDLQGFLDKGPTFPPDSKDGFELNIKARNPVFPDSDATVPVYAAPYVLKDHGEGAVMAVPAHDTRDLAFWKLHRPHDTVPVVVGEASLPRESLRVLPKELKEPHTADGVLTSLCGKYEGLSSSEARSKIVADLSKQNQAQEQETWRLRDWLVSRQRYWGAPIPIIHCKSCGAVPVPEEELPVLLPKLPPGIQGQTGNPLDKIPEFFNCECPQCHQPARRETDTMDTFVDSSWYYGRFADSHNSDQLFSQASAEQWLPVDLYVGGVEHAILHLLYARFIYKFLCEEGLVPFPLPDREPFQRLIAQGMVHGKTFSNPETGQFLLPHEVDHSGASPVIVSSGTAPNITWEKMSKSKHNGVDPTTCIEKYGADATRAHILFSAPVSEVLQWDEQAISGIQRWFVRIHDVALTIGKRAQKGYRSLSALEVEDVTSLGETEARILLDSQRYIEGVTKKYEEVYSLNTAVSDLMKLTTALQDAGVDKIDNRVAELVYATLLRMLAPIAPAFAEECWEKSYLGLFTGIETVLDADWPTRILSPEAEEAVKSLGTSMACTVQVNGKMRFTTRIPTSLSQDPPSNNARREREAQILQSLLSTEDGKLWLIERNDWAKRKKVIIVRDGKLVNIVF
jgi:leucyl-tRNA synthetase